MLACAISGIWGLAFASLTEKPEASIADLAGVAIFMLLAPFAGRRHAAARAAGRGGTAAYVTRWTPTVVGGGDERGLLVTELTSQTLRYLNGHPGAANIDIARAVDVRHESQMSRHLGRLERAGDGRAPQGGSDERLAAHRPRRGGGAHVARSAARCAAADHTALGPRPAASRPEMARPDLSWRSRCQRTRTVYYEGNGSMNNVLLRLAEPARKVLTSAVLALALVAYAAAGASAAQTADACSNAAIRAQQDAQSLPGCRAYEQVTPVAKGGSFVNVSQASQSARAAGAIAYQATSGPPGTAASPAVGTYGAVRTDQGWTFRSFDLPQVNPGTQLVWPTRWLSPDLTKSVGASKALLGPDAVAGNSGVYISDFSTGDRTLIAQAPSFELFNSFTDIFGGPVWGATDDLRHVVFETTADLGQGATPGVSNVWEWADGHLRLVSRMPDNAPFPAGGFLKNQNIAFQFPNRVSADGSKIFFTANNAVSTWVTGPIYVRENGTTTKLVSHSQRTGDDPTVPDETADFVGASTDGRYVFFQSWRPLTDDADTTGNANYLYRADVLTNTLTLAVNRSDRTDPLFVQRISGDGERIYFLGASLLTPSAAPGSLHLYLWDHGVVKLVANVGVDVAMWFSMSDDGRYVEFSSNGSPTGFDSTSSACLDDAGAPRACSEVYAYDAQTGVLGCMSCASSGASGGDATVGPPPGSSIVSTFAPRGVLADGTRIFDTPTALVSQDINRKRDVYEYKDGKVRLLSSGVDRNDASFLDASADGTDVYFTTYGRLVGQDTDTLRDIYTVRRDGGLVAQNVVTKRPAECVLDACQGAPTVPGSLLDVGSVTFTGAGNAAPGVAEGLRSVVSVSKLKAVTGTSASLRVKVSGAGAIRVSGSSVRSVARSVGKAGTYTVKLALTAKARTSLKKHKAANVRVRVAFSPQAGRASSKTLTVTFKQPNSRAGKRRASHRSLAGGR